VIIWHWDPEKDRLSGLGLAVGTSVFADPLAVSRPDPNPGETRWQTIGGIAVLFVVHTEPVREPDGRIVGRIIRVRKAIRHERKAYEEGTF
jgi:uncharacterized DUF497 family protein